ncbi:MAG: DUF1156 domain-containing protein, partial [Acidobacteriota bacterium]
MENANLDDRRLIEDYLPIEAISAEASREKSPQKGYISTLHLWWARRPLVACRAAVYGALVPARRFRPANGPEEKLESLTRANAAKFVERLCKYPGVPQVILEAQNHILEAHAERLSRETGNQVTVEDILEGRAPRPKVLDMFAGGGAIPLEALRLGCDAYALDLNPVAHIIELCTLVYPQKYGKPDPDARGMTGPKNAKGDSTWGGLAEEVRYWGNWVLEKVKAEIGDLYPLIPDPRFKGRKALRQANMWRPAEADGVPPGYLVPVAYLWTRTVSCKNPSCRKTVPLVRQTWLCRKSAARKSPGRYVALRIHAPDQSHNVHFEVIEANSVKALRFDPSAGSERGDATCPFCGTVADTDFIKAEGRSRRLGQQLMAVACSQPGSQGKRYISADDTPESALDVPALEKRLEELLKRTSLSPLREPLPPIGTLGFRIQAYGMKCWGDLFTLRQTASLMTLAAAVRPAEEQMQTVGHASDRIVAVVTLLAAMVDRLASFSSSQCVWLGVDGERTANMFGRHALPMVWDFSETSPLNEENAGWPIAIDRVVSALQTAAEVTRPAIVARGSATELSWDDCAFDAVITDPPYYDNVPYADISDFFYVWLKRTIGHLYSDHFSTELTPKKKEAVAEPVRHGGDRDAARVAYEEMMARSFAEASRVLKPGGQLTVVYAHKTTLGWSTLVDALRRAGFIVTEAWPLDTEKPGRLRAQGSAALASSIFLVARKRDGAETGSYEDDVRPELERIVRERVDSLWKMGITSADLVIAAVGAGLRAFTRFSRVEYHSGE